MITNISNAYIGDASISRIYQGGELVYINSHPDIRLDWIANGPDDGSVNPNVYFSTGVTPQLYTAVEFKFETATMVTGRIFGCGNANTATTMYNFNMYAGGNTPSGTTKTSLKFFYRGANVAADFTPQVNTPYTVSLWGTYSGNSATDILMTVNGTMYQRSMTASTNITEASSAYVFKWNGYTGGTDGVDTPSGVKFYYIKMWNENNLVRFMIPVLHYTNNQYVPCFYDKVNDIYMYNLGTDNPTYKISADYMLDYIGCSINGTLSYDSGVDVARGLGIDVRFKAGSTVANGNTNEGLIVGVRDASANKYGIYAPYAGISGSTTANWHVGLKGLGYNLSTTSNDEFNTDYKVSTSPSMGTKNLFVNSTKYTSSTAESTTAGVIGSRINIFGNTLQGGWKDTCINYCIITNTVGSGRIPACSKIPVFHNNQAAFLDLNSGTYIYNMGTQIPYYQFKS